MESFWLSKSAYCNRESEGTPKSAQVKDPRFIPQGYISLYSSPWRGLQENQVMAFSAWKGSSVVAQDALFLSISKLSPLHLTDRHKVKRWAGMRVFKCLEISRVLLKKLEGSWGRGKGYRDTHTERCTKKGQNDKRMPSVGLSWVHTAPLCICSFRKEVRPQKTGIIHAIVWEEKL